GAAQGREKIAALQTRGEEAGRPGESAGTSEWLGARHGATVVKRRRGQPRHSRPGENDENRLDTLRADQCALDAERSGQIGYFACVDRARRQRGCASQKRAPTNGRTGQ